MTRAPEDRNGRQALVALAEAARGAVQPPRSQRLDQGLQALSARLGGARVRRRAALRWSLVGVASAVVVMLAIGRIVLLPRGLWPLAGAPALTYRVEGGSVSDGGYLRESGGGASMKLFFAGGTEVELTPGSRGRLRAVDAGGARVAIEQGNASFRVVPQVGRRWLVEVGPFLVTVKGTEFSVSWNASSERFQLRLQRGRVTVSGPISGGDITLVAGQRLVVDLHRSETLIAALESEEARGEGDAASGRPLPAPARSNDPAPTPALAPIPGPASIPAPPSTEQRAGAGGGLASAHLGRSDNEHHWADALASGHLVEILEEVERLGVRTTLEKASGQDLFALADAARYRRKMDLARDALLAARRRFPGTARALEAAFLLGRVEESSDGGMPKAVEWYDEYLTQTPRGTYAAEALGRKMILTSELEGTTRAAPIAEEYLRRFPSGTYTRSARVLRTPP